MKKLFTLIALCAMAFVACDNTNEGPTGGTSNQNLQLKLASESVMRFGVEGGQGQIKFDLVEAETEAQATRFSPVPAPMPEASAKADWVTDVRIGDGVVDFVVAANDGVERNTSITVKYGTQSFIVMVMQAGVVVPDVTFNPTHLGGTYYGKMRTRGFDYFVILSDMQPKAVTSKPSNATEYRFDIYASEGSAFNSTHRVPVGTYKLDLTRSGEPGTIDGFKDCSYLFDANYNVTTYRDATVVVTEDSIIADVTLTNGEIHHVEYHGSTVMEDYSEPTYADVYPVSQYTSDINFNVTGGYISAYYRGDYFGVGMDNWFLHMIEQKAGFSGVYLLFDFIVPKSVGGWENQQGFVGEYSIFTEIPSDYSYTIGAGRLRDDSLQLYAWYLYCVGGQVDMSRAAPLRGGTVKVESTGGNNYKVTVDSFDDNGNKIQGTFEAVLGDYDNQNCD